MNQPKGHDESGENPDFGSGVLDDPEARLLLTTDDVGAYSTANSETLAKIENFWPEMRTECEKCPESDFKRQRDIPLARIKKIMKMDENVKMISQETPVLFAKACELFIREITLNAWKYTEENKRRTLQKNDVAAAAAKNDQFDFLIDIVPRDEITRTPVPPQQQQQHQVPKTERISSPQQQQPQQQQQQQQQQPAADTSAYYVNLAQQASGNLDKSQQSGLKIPQNSLFTFPLVASSNETAPQVFNTSSNQSLQTILLASSGSGGGNYLQMVPTSGSQQPIILTPSSLLNLPAQSNVVTLQQQQQQSTSSEQPQDPEQKQEDKEANGGGDQRKT